MRVKNGVLIGSILCFIAAVSWGAMFPVAHEAFKHIDPFYFTIFRYGAVTLILMVLLFWKEGKSAFRFEGKGIQLWFFGTMAFTVYNLFIFWGEDLLGHSGVMTASIMESLMPMISIVIAWMFYKHHPSIFTLVCVVVAFIGAVLVITKGDLHSFLGASEQLLPSLLIFIAVVGWVIYTMGGKTFSAWSALRYSTLSCLLGTVTAIIITIGATVFDAVSAPSTTDVMAVWPHLLFMIVFPGLIALLGWNVGVTLLSPLNALLFINFVPVTTLLVSVVQGHSITMFDFVGTILIIISLISNNFYLRMLGKKGEKATKHALRERIS